MGLFNLSDGSYLNLGNQAEVPGLSNISLGGGGRYTGGFTFSGAGCAIYSTAVNETGAGIGLVEDDIWQMAALGPDDLDPIGLGQGQLPQSDCVDDCMRNVGLNPNITYQSIFLNSAADRAQIQANFLTFVDQAEGAKV